MGFDINGIHHISLRVTDLQRSRRFYEGVLGFEVDQDFPPAPDHPGKVRLRFGPDNSLRLVLAPPLPGTPKGDRFDERRTGLDHVAVSVPAAVLDELVEVLRANNVETRGIQRDPMGPGLVSFRDPDNIQWEFFEA